MKRILGLDVGSKTIGVAVSDPMGWTAQGVKTIRRKDLAADHQEILKCMGDFEVDELVIGLPLSLNGSEGSQAAQVRRFAETLTPLVTVPITYWDERLSTSGAERGLLEADLSRAARKKVIDKMAAVFILQGYLDTKGGA